MQYLCTEITGKHTAAVCHTIFSKTQNTHSNMVCKGSQKWTLSYIINPWWVYKWGASRE